ncbi:MAG: replicative DNA helicase [Dehalococcoidales bacterium]|nr:replicative DNA helicase [Dehalococcoidales bacterium]
MLERTPPYNIETERAVLGSMLLDNQIIDSVSEILSPEDFYTTAHKKIYELIIKNYKTTPIDIITFGQFLDKDAFNNIGGASYIAELTDNVPSAVNAEHYAKIVKEFSLRRQLLNTAYEITNAAYDINQPVTEIIDQAQKSTLLINPLSTGETIKTSAEVCRETMALIELRSKGTGLIGISTGLTDLDEVSGGIVPKCLTIIAGRPGMGKSCLAMNIADSAALDGNPSLILSLEMQNVDLMMRQFASRIRVENRQIRKGFIAQSDWSKLVSAAQSIADVPLYYDDSAFMTTDELRRRVRRAVKDYGIKLLMVDYLQLVKSVKKGERRDLEVGEISATLKGISKEMNIAVLALSQLNRKVEERPDKRPMMSDLRETGAIEQDADVIMFVYRDEVYNKNEDNPDKGIAEINVAKNRHGAVGMIKAVFNERYQQFSNLSSVSVKFSKERSSYGYE